MKPRLHTKCYQQILHHVDNKLMQRQHVDSVSGKIQVGVTILAAKCSSHTLQNIHVCAAMKTEAQKCPQTF